MSPVAHVRNRSVTLVPSLFESDVWWVGRVHSVAVDRDCGDPDDGRARRGLFLAVAEDEKRYVDLQCIRQLEHRVHRWVSGAGAAA